MTIQLRWIGAAVATVVLMLSGCVGGEPISQQPGAAPSELVPTPSELAPTPSAPVPAPSEQVPDAQQLAAMLVAGDDLGGDWSVNPWGEPPTDRSSLGFGKFGLQVCDDAPEEFEAAETALRWQAFRHLDRGPDGSTVEELLLADESGAAASLYATLEAGLEACMGYRDTDDRGRTWTREPMPVPEVGDERIGVLTTIRQGADVVDELHGVLVRDGPVLMYALVMGRVDGDEPAMSDDEVDQVIRTMAGKVAQPA